ncbi:Receptor homology region, transmembrane domain- and RING domain-containing protein 3 [Smittium culicis]|uniref:RING-type E3 ubiquitin transferase n=1 Tax=Smittium culicis TaxID=133412 RepID=A0A1R1YMU3_9FUNG|nr:Receptor homology region, transmembrane domain- and RING domain-containing protein 3 [Smittium culicis]
MLVTIIILFFRIKIGFSRRRSRPYPEEELAQYQEPDLRKRKDHLSKHELEFYPIVPFSPSNVHSKKKSKLKNSVVDRHNSNLNSGPGSSPESFSLSVNFDIANRKSASSSILKCPSSDDHVLKVKEINDAQTHDYDCLICFEVIDIGDSIREIPCNHIFHLNCLDTWLKSRSVYCPTCRFNLHVDSSNFSPNFANTNSLTLPAATHNSDIDNSNSFIGYNNSTSDTNSMSNVEISSSSINSMSNAQINSSIINVASSTKTNGNIASNMDSILINDTSIINTVKH